MMPFAGKNHAVWTLELRVETGVKTSEISWLLHHVVLFGAHRNVEIIWDYDYVREKLFRWPIWSGVFQIFSLFPCQCVFWMMKQWKPPARWIRFTSTCWWIPNKISTQFSSTFGRLYFHLTSFRIASGQNCLATCQIPFPRSYLISHYIPVRPISSQYMCIPIYIIVYHGGIFKNHLNIHIYIYISCFIT